MAYTAYLLTKESRDLLLSRFPPKHKDVIAHHVTVKFGVPKTLDVVTGFQQVVDVVGYAEADGIEAAVVSVGGEIKRKDGKVFHITLSLDRSIGRKPVDSNTIISTNGWTPVPPFKLQTTFELLD